MLTGAMMLYILSSSITYILKGISVSDNYIKQKTKKCINAGQTEILLST